MNDTFDAHNLRHFVIRDVLSDEEIRMREFQLIPAPTEDKQNEIMDTNQC